MTGRTGPNNSRTKITFSSLASPPQLLLLLHILTWWHSVKTSWLLSIPLRLTISIMIRTVLRNTCAWAHVRQMLPLVVLVWETFQKVTLFHPIRKNGKSNKSLSGVERNQAGMPSGLPLEHLHLTSVVESEGMIKRPASVKDRQCPTREGKLQWKVYLQPHLEQGAMPLVERSHGYACFFFLSYRWELEVPESLL